MRQQGWYVFRPNAIGYLEWITTVYYDLDCDADYVRDGLINHDGYSTDIVVRRVR